MPTYFVYPIYTIVIFLLTYAIVPRQEIRYLIRYGIVSSFQTSYRTLESLSGTGELLLSPQLFIFFGI